MRKLPGSSTRPPWTSRAFIRGPPPAELRRNQEDRHRRILISVARCTNAVVAVANHKRAAGHQIPLYEDHRRHWLALTDLFQIVSHMPLVRRQQGQIAGTQNI